MADPLTNADGRYVIQPAETSADTLQLTARTASDVIVAATSAVSFTSASLSTLILKVTVNGTVYYIPASSVSW